MILNDFKLNNKQKELFEKYFEFLTEENKKYNLTSITKKDEVYSKHFYDCLKLNDFVSFSNVKRVLDIGSGAGFPGIPLKIINPDLILTIIEPTLKRVKFLEQLVALLNLDNVQVINGRAEDMEPNFRENFDIVTARAVALLPILLELCLPYVKVNGFFLAMKGISYQQELEDSARALKLLEAELSEKYHYRLPGEMGERVILKILKKQATKEIYPRKYAAIKKKHL
jgi:16S rRNA (guanine527-N7)-methyltransferase